MTIHLPKDLERWAFATSEKRGVNFAEDMGLDFDLAEDPHACLGCGHGINCVDLGLRLEPVQGFGPPALDLIRPLVPTDLVDGFLAGRDHPDLCHADESPGMGLVATSNRLTG